MSAVRSDAVPAPLVPALVAPEAAPSGGSPAQRAGSAGLFLVRAPARRAARTPFAVLVLVIASLGLLGLLLVNTRLQEGAVAVTRLDRENRTLREQTEALAQAVEVAAAPQRLATRAQDLGMVANPGAAYLRLSDGAVVGEALAAALPEPPAPPESDSAAAPEPDPAADPAATPGPDPAAAPAPDPAAVAPAEPVAEPPVDPTTLIPPALPAPADPGAPQ